MKENKMHKIIQEETATILMIQKGCKVLNAGNSNAAELPLQQPSTVPGSRAWSPQHQQYPRPGLADTLERCT